jgi:hypothetical protein
MMTRSVRTSESGFVTLIELLVVVAIMLFMAYLFLGGQGGTSRQVGRELGPARPGGPTSMPGRSIDAARGAECRSDLDQVRKAIQMQTMESEKPPASLRDLGLPPQILSCPVSHDPYRYDPGTGKVNCVTPGHENY